MKPSDLPLVGLGGCTGYDVVDILLKKRQQLAGLEVVITGEQDAIALSEEKYCSVATTVRGVAEITQEYTIVEEE